MPNKSANILKEIIMIQKNERSIFSSLRVIVLSITVLALCWSIAFPVLALESNIVSKREPTLGEIEKQLYSYLEKNHPDSVVDTESYVGFLMEQLLEEVDEKLAAFENYNDICVYMSAYISEIQTIQIDELIDELFVLQEPARSQTASERRAKVVEKESALMEEYDIAKSQSKAQAPKAAVFNSSNAVTYATTYALGRNNQYNWHFADCTNFISQCLVAGGISMKRPSGLLTTGIYSTTSYWYSERYEEWHGNNSVTKWDESSSFVNVDDLATYLVNNTTVSITTTYNKSDVQNASIGDIVQLQNSGGDWHHSIIITGGSSGNRTYSAHSTNRLDYAVDNLSSSRYRIIHMY